MADKEFKNLSKGELIEIIYQMKKNELRLHSELQTATAELKKKNLKIRDAGSIAEAVVSLNDLFETAQKTADDYLEQIHAANANIEERCRQLEEETKQKCLQKEQEADRLIAEKWKVFRLKVQEYVAKVQDYAKSQGQANPQMQMNPQMQANPQAQQNPQARANPQGQMNPQMQANPQARARFSRVPRK